VSSRLLARTRGDAYGIGVAKVGFSLILTPRRVP
jgi:hypothetical protein